MVVKDLSFRLFQKIYHLQSTTEPVHVDISSVMILHSQGEQVIILYILSNQLTIKIRFTIVYAIQSLVSLVAIDYNII